MASGMDQRPNKKRKISLSNHFENATDSGAVGESENEYDSVSYEDEDSNQQEESEGADSTEEDGNMNFKSRAENQSKREQRFSSDRRQAADLARPVDGFELQIRELLRRVKPKYLEMEALLERTLSQIKDAINLAPESGPLSVHEAQSDISSSHITIPFPEPLLNTGVNYKFTFSKPAKITLVGEFAQRIAVRSDEEIHVTLAVQMPGNIFTEKDYLNNRYFHKRAYYLAKISTAVLQCLGQGADVTFEHEDGNPYLPLLSIQLRVADSQNSFARSKTTIKVVPYVAEDVLPATKTLPNQSCLRNSKSEKSSGKELQPTPFYNSSLRHNVTTSLCHDLLSAMPKRCAGFQDACVLGSVWLRQRGYGGSLERGGFGSLEWSILLALLLKEGGARGLPTLLPTFNGLQLFRATLQFLARTDLMKQALVIGPTDFSPTQSRSMPMLFCASTASNLLFKMTAWSYQDLRKEAQISIRVLNKASNHSFESCFIVKLDIPFLRFDYVVEITLPGSGPADDFVQDEPVEISHAKQVYELLCKSLADRVTSISIRFATSDRWSIQSKVPGPSPEHPLLVGLTINANVALRKVDRGPAVEDEKAAYAFRKFWGTKSEQRRFKDGSVLETVSWKGRDARSLIQEVVAYTINSHIGNFNGDEIVIKGNDLAAVLPEHSPNNASFDSTKETYEELESNIRGLQGMPLHIRQIRPASSALCFTSRRVPGRSGSEHQDPIDVTVQFEGSGRWPDDLNAIQMTKAAFLLKLEDLLKDAASQPATMVGVENNDAGLRNKFFLKAAFPNSHTFHIRIHHEREQALIENRLKSKAASPKDRKIAADALVSYKRSFERKAMHVEVMKMSAQRFLALSPATRLLKAWFGAHLLNCHICEDLIDLISVHAFVQPFPWTAPNTAMTGFFRSLLFLSRWDWQHEPLLVDFNDDITQDGHEAIKLRFQAWRKIDPAMNRLAIFAATNFDTDGTTWSEYHPSKVVASRMTALAKAATDIIIRDGVNVQMGKLFKLSLKNYDFILNLEPRYTNAEKRSDLLKNVQKESRRLTSTSGHQLVRAYFEELRLTYADAALFFYDVNAGNVIAGIWNPAAAKRLWKASIPYSTQLSVGKDDKGVEAVLNKSAILAEMARLGGDLVSHVTSR